MRRVGDLALAEDATQDAFAAAALAWPREGVPPNPSAWLMLSARRKAIDRLRREAARDLRDRAYVSDRIAHDDPSEDEEMMHDDRLQLIFLCAHPALAPDARVALTLRCVAGLETGAIARAFLVAEATMAQRIVRAKRRVKAAGIPFRIPAAHELADRLATVLAVIYLVFNEGYAATSGDRPVRAELCDEAIRLARLVAGLMPAHAEAAGLLALMLLHHARTPARIDGTEIVALDAQDRGRWDRTRIDEGLAILDAAFARRAPGPFQVQAAIVALHARAPTFEATDWPQIARLYGVLGAMTPSPVVELNRAVAIAMADGPAPGLALLRPLLGDAALAGYAPLHAAHADLLRRDGDARGASDAYRRAAAASGTPAQRDALLRRAAACDDSNLNP